MTEVELRPVTDADRAYCYLGRIELHPDFRGRGIGTTLIRRLIARAGDRPLSLDVLYVNRRAYALYARLGFREIRRHGPGDIKIRMRYGGHPGTP